MSTKYPGGVISKTAPVPAGPYETGAAPGVWTLEQQAAYAKQGIWPTAGLVPNYIEDVFSTWLYTGNGPSSQTITNGIDLSGKGGLVWTKARTAPFALNNSLIDTVRGNQYQLYSDLTNAQANLGTNPTLQAISSFNSNGFTLGGDQSSGCANYSSSVTYASWTFREQPKFFDVVTYTGDGVSGRTVAHNLGSVPGCMIVKRLNDVSLWRVYHRSLGATQNLKLNDTVAAATESIIWNDTAPTSTEFTLGNNSNVNGNGVPYVAYLFAHDAGGFGLTGTDNVISCGSFTTDGSGLATVNLGYEPQWVMVKSTSAAGNWFMFDTMRGYTADTTSGTDARLFANTSGSEVNTTAYGGPNATGFTGYIAASTTYIYIAIRRGPMKVPTSGTKVFAPVKRTGSGTTATVTSTVTPTDLMFSTNTDRVASSINGFWDRLRGASLYLNSNTANAEVSNPSINGFDVQNGVRMTGNLPTNGNGYPYVNYSFGRAPSFFDEVCYTGTGANRTVTHNLAAVPELMIVKNRVQVGGENWTVYTTATTATKAMYLNTTGQAVTASVFWNNTDPTSTVFSVGTAGNVNTNTETYVAYLFATCAGVSKVGSYTGTGATQTVACGFGAGGARFVLVKRTDTTGDWYVWDSARGMVSGTDPSLLLNSTAAEVNANSIYTISTGFQIVSTAAGINASGGTYIFLAIA